jgi:translation elongation factor EF-1alpha
LDKLKKKEKRGVTIDLSYQKVITPKTTNYNIDAPGHKDLLKYDTGASQADAAF